MSGLLRLLLEHAPDQPELIPQVYGMVADRIRSRVLDEDEAAVIASWFDRLEAGEAPEKVFIRPRTGRPSGKATKPRPDDVDVYWFVHWNRAAGHKPGDVYTHVAKLCGMRPGTVRNIYSRIKNQGGPK